MTDSKDRPARRGQNDRKRACALFWDESLAWGLMARQALIEAGLPFDLIGSEEIRRGALFPYRMLFVPGGWASNRLSALGDRGCDQLLRFVEAGGNYLGICGGAGLATQEGLGLLPVRRKSSTERVASFSGPIGLTLADHPIWQGIGTSPFFAWWPSQFQIENQETRVLATYAEASPEAFSSDIPVKVGKAQGWQVLEERYGILLDPERLRSEPAVIEGHFGKGRVILSLVHFDTPADPNGSAVLQNLWKYLSPEWKADAETGDSAARCRFLIELSQEQTAALGNIEDAVADLIDTGSRHSLWRWRNPFLLQWRRGVRGLEYGTLAVMIREIGALLRRAGSDDGSEGRDAVHRPAPEESLLEIRERIVPFVEWAKELLEMERRFMQTAPLSPLECPDREISRLRSDLFGPAMSHGGRFKQLIDRVDRLLAALIRGG